MKIQKLANITQSESGVNPEVLMTVDEKNFVLTRDYRLSITKQLLITSVKLSFERVACHRKLSFEINQQLN